VHQHDALGARRDRAGCRKTIYAQCRRDCGCGHRARAADVGLLATKYTMEQPFDVQRLRENDGLDVLTPGPGERAEARRIIFDELARGQVKASSRETYRQIMAALVDRGAEGILLGCTEIDLLVGPADADVALFDTTARHAERAVELALQ